MTEMQAQDGQRRGSHVEKLPPPVKMSKKRTGITSLLLTPYLEAARNDPRWTQEVPGYAGFTHDDLVILLTKHILEMGVPQTTIEADLNLAVMSWHEKSITLLAWEQAQLHRNGLAIDAGSAI